MNFEVIGTGHYAPENVVTNDDLAKFLDTSDEWISTRVGVRERRVCTTETTAELAYRASKNALEMAGTNPEELDLILCATISADDASPSLACNLQKLLGAECPAMDLNAACSGFIYMLETAAGFFARGTAKKVLVVGAERMSRLLNWNDRSTCVIFGDGAGAMVLSAGSSYLASKIYAKGNTDVIRIPHPQGMSPFYKNESEEPFVLMNGQETFKFAVNAMTKDVQEVIEKAGLTQEDIAYVIPHQANLRIIDSAKRKLSIPPERFCSNIERYGNTSAASIPILVDELNRDGKFKDNDKLVLCSFGGGLSSAACVLEWKCR